MTLLGLIQEFCLRRGIPKPQYVMASQDDQLLQLVALANEVMDDLSTRRVWEKFQKEATWTSTAAEDQGALETLAPGLQWINNGTIWDRTLQLPAYGPKSAREWQTLKALNNAGVTGQYRVRGGHLLFTPALPAGHTMAFEYTSPYLVLATDQTTYKEYFTADTDTFLLSSKILLAGLAWKWKYEKGFKYAEEFRAYESIVADFAGHDGTKPVLRMDNEESSASPCVVVPNGNWSLP